jgi:hypothetical protein
MRATRALCAKELAQHGVSLLVVTLLLLLAWSLTGISFSRQARTLSELERVALFLRGPLVVAAVYLGHRLVVSEHYARTQRFLEALPIGRLHAAWVKAALGLAVVLGWALLALLGGALAASANEPLGGRFLGLLLARVTVFALALWAVVFVFGTFGRLRIMLAVVLVTVLVVLDKVGGVQLDRLGPLALTDPDRLPFERALLPIGPLLQSAAVALVAFGAAFALLRIREGGVVENLSRRMSPREVSALFVVVMVATFPLLAMDRQQPPEPYSPPADHLWQAPITSAGGPALRVSYQSDELRPVAERLGTTLARRVTDLHRLLGLQPPAVVDLVHGPEVRPRRISVISGDVTGPLAVRATLEAPVEAWPDTIADVLHALLTVRSRGLVQREARHWLVDGVATHLALHGAEPPAADLLDVGLLRAAALAPVDFDPGTLRAYGPLSEQLGDPAAMAFAASGVRVLHDLLGPQRFWSLARELLVHTPRGNLRGYLHVVRHPVDAAVARATGLTFPDFVARWREHLAGLRRRADVAAALTAEPLGAGRLVTRARPLRLELELRWRSGPGRPALCTLRHTKLGPVDLPVSEDALEEESFTVPPAPPPRPDAPEWGPPLTRALPASYGAGERAFVAVDCESSWLAGPVRVFASRVTIP